MPSLSSLWLSIERSVVDRSSIRFLDTGVSFPTGPVLAGLDGAHQRHLCIPAPAGELGRYDRQSRGVTVEVRPLLAENSRELPFVDIHCRKPELNSLFEILAADVLKESQRRPESPFAAAHSVLERWRELLEPDPGALLGQAQLAALLAELLLLERFGQGGVPPVRFWCGPEKGPHDFVCGEVDFEVKSTLSATRREVMIHGLSQLTESPGARLFLWWVRLRPSPGRGTSVPEVVERLIERGADNSMLLGKLRLQGYTHADAESYRSTAFEIIESALYLVDPAFPRLTESSFVGGVPQRVIRIDYTLSLDASVPASLGSSAADDVLNSVK